MMTGTRLLEFARLWFSPAVVATVFEPLMADWLHARLQQPAASRWRTDARWAAAFLSTLVLSLSRALLWTAVPTGTLRRPLARLIVSTAVISGLMLLPFLTELRTVAAPRLGVLMLLILPSIVAIAFPFALFCSVDAIRRSGRPSAEERITALRFAIAGIVVSALLGGAAMPAANQLFRQSVGADVNVSRGIRELSTYELAVHPSRANSAERFSEAGYVRRELQTRGMMAVLPAVLVWLRWVFLGARRRSSTPASGATIAVMAVFFGFYFLGINSEQVLSLRPGSGTWLPIAALAVAGLARVLLSPHDGQEARTA
jgi:hypothetical protein